MHLLYYTAADFYLNVLTFVQGNMYKNVTAAPFLNIENNLVVHQ